VATLVIIVICAVIFTFFTSLSEAALYAVPVSTARTLAKKNKRGGLALDKIKRDMSRVISAILILNIIGNTVGAAFAGAQAGEIWPEVGVVAFSAVFTVLILMVGEIVPKTLGVTYALPISLFVAPIWLVIARVMGPVVYAASAVSKLFGPKNSSAQVSHEEILSLVNLGASEGTIDQFEEQVIQNVIQIDETLVKDILTPRTAVFSLSERVTIEQARSEIISNQFSRIPLYIPSDPDNLTGYVTHREILESLLAGEGKKQLRDIAHPIKTMPELATIRNVMTEMLKDHEHICALVDEFGSLAGIVTLEDIMEDLVGAEIEDESDKNGG
jgi:CBS domain containing-hemolysin-like protein